MTRVKLIGLTGQSGAGKSTAAELFEENGMTVINADALVAEIYESSPACLKSVAASFGADIINPDGTLNRQLLARRAFESKDNTALLGAIVHPFVIAETLKILKTLSGTVVFDAPQLFESNMDAVCDVIVSVTADEGVRAGRIIERDGLTREQARERISAQHSEEFFRSHSDYILENNGNILRFKAQTSALIEKIQAEVM
ncbi:dephospho-CoA kinase [Ruminococcus sp.]|uniref:dephospho-CoA kinase n=1 Tax=Ruminococcus sp. TaxID=41978 RepID=UPI002E7A43F4|nr:dephospho-CoA kinase [Ruminococcus sp.]MEE1262903.1 dephospho-CoA kinase [Ruminococcus sp.]